MDKQGGPRPLCGAFFVENWCKARIFCRIFNFYCPYRGKLCPIIIVLGVNLCYTISVSLCLKIGRAGFRACFPRVGTAVLAGREAKMRPAAAGCCMPARLPKNFRPCSKRSAGCCRIGAGKARCLYFVIWGSRCVSFAPKSGGNWRGGGALP